MHSTARQAATIATKAHARKLIIGHFSARVDDHELFLNEAQEVFPNTVMAVEGETIEL
jgi:ribonuclease Z